MKQLPVIFFALFIVAGSHSQAALIDNGRSTYDTSTGLHWLDLTETIGLAPSVTSELNRYFEDNWLVASGDQVDALFWEAGAPRTAFGFSFSRDSTVTDKLFSLLGVTYDSGEELRLGSGWADNGGGIYSLPSYLEEPGISPYITNGSQNVRPVQSLSSAGVYLVRPVPAPSIFSLLLLAAILLSHLQRISRH